ncbi:Sedlin [Polychytrium aggregatum]|uniref:Sedlin n=1 Tax=Polychytrium aggregatum TaxID=110093 RepID=UPI0022FF2EBD|nr:Sedlin [Polychytrium aggregatum]KAI9199564.1 Sedlin [Polychytrium aggregatum]
MSGTTINAIAVIGKQNNPIYIQSFQGSHSDIKYHFLSHTACDIIEERLTSAAFTKSSDLYLGLLHSMEDLAVYGYMTNTRIKIVVIITLTDTAVKDAEMKNVLRKIHTAYVNLVSNPFYDPEGPNGICSKSFNTAINEIAGIAAV